MKKVLFYLSMAITLVGCSSPSENEQLIKNYLLEKDYPKVVTAVSLLNGELKEYSIKNFNNNPVDTIYMWQYYKDWDLEFAEKDYVHSLERLKDLYSWNLDFAGTKLVKSTEEARELKEKVKQDSIKLEEARATYEQYKKDKDVFALGYEFDLLIKTKLAGNVAEKVQHKIGYITSDKKVTKIVDK